MGSRSPRTSHQTTSLYTFDTIGLKMKEVLDPTKQKTVLPSESSSMLRNTAWKILLNLGLRSIGHFSLRIGLSHTPCLTRDRPTFFIHLPRSPTLCIQHSTVYTLHCTAHTSHSPQLRHNSQHSSGRAGLAGGFENVGQSVFEIPRYRDTIT